jgi:ELWxxDGT repeat protein
MIIKYYFETVLNPALVADLNPGPAHAYEIPFGIANRNSWGCGFAGALYFQANDGQSGAELWRTTGAGAELVADIEPGPSGSAPHAFAVYQDSLYFAATTWETGEELFRYDGTTVSLAADIEPGPDGGKIAGLTVYKDALYFTRQAPGEKKKVWRFDGTSVVPVAAINQTEYASFKTMGRTFTVFDGRLFYILEKPPYELWAYDGANAQLIANLSPENDFSSYNLGLGVYKGALYFGVVGSKPEKPEKQDELWRYNVQAAPKKIEKIATLDGGSILTQTGSQPADFQVFQGWLYFSTTIGTLYRYDGAGVPEPVSQSSPTIPTQVRNLSLYAEKGGLSLLYFAASSNNVLSSEPYVFNGVEASLIKNIMPENGGVYPGSLPTRAVQVGDRLYFFAQDAEHGYELWNVRPERILKINAILVPIWEDAAAWPVAEGVRDLVLATYLVTEGQTPRLVARKAVRLPVEPEFLRFPVLEIDQSRYALPDAFGLLSVVFDRRTGEKLDVGVQVFGVSTDDARVAIQQTVAAHRDKALFQPVMAARIQVLDTARTPDEPTQGGSSLG